MKEIWKPFRHGVYEVSNLGNVRRVMPDSTGRTACIRQMRLQHNYKGYVQVQTNVNRRRKHYFIHVLVAKKFIGPCPLGKEVNHKDLNKENNWWNNLEYITHQENVDHAVSKGLYKKPSGENSPCSKLTQKQAESIRLLYANGVSQYKLGKRFNVNSGTIHGIVNNRSYV